MGPMKALYIVSDGLGPIIGKIVSDSLSLSEGAFTLMFDETTTTQNRNQMDTLEMVVVTRYLMSFFFAQAQAVDVAELFTELQEKAIMKKYPIQGNAL